MNASLSATPNRRGLIWISGALAVVVLGAIGWYAAGHTGSGSIASLDSSPASASSTDDSGTGILLGLADTAIKDSHLVAPAGSNAYEFYLSVLQLDAQNKTAQQNMHDLFGSASEEVERSINNNDLDEAQRELGLLREFDSTNYTLSLLGGKLDAARQVMIKQDEARAAAIQAANAQGGAAH
jgi:periplasmic protein TonB